VDLQNEGRVALVTGGAQGIGHAIAVELHRRGHHVVIADVNVDAALAAAGALGADRASSLAIDVSSSASVDAARDEILARHGHMDVLVNNAGVAANSPTLEQSDADWQRVLDVNLTGVFHMCRAFGPALVERRGAIVNISSIAAFAAPRPEVHAGYDATKAAVAAFTRTLAVELAASGVRVNAVAPGYADTDMLRSVGVDDPDTMAAWMSAIPQRRLIPPVEIARVVAFLASDDASAITGQTILADGGWAAAK
jgi:NAD(P)-dependent dehydrogenase (short-subunit alcohol dehydrogenase family)